MGDHFGNTLVVPCHYVLFTLLTIVGNGILYDEFKVDSEKQVLLFVLGILSTFGGVGIISSGRATEEEESMLVGAVDETDQEYKKLHAIGNNLPSLSLSLGARPSLSVHLQDASPARAMRRSISSRTPLNRR